MVLDERLAIRAALTGDARPRVLVVDDDESVLLTIQGILELDEYDVVARPSGASALELLRTESFDLVLTDLRLEDLDGIELLHELRNKSPDAVGIMLTGHASLESAVNALREGAYDYLIKPCDVLQLRTAVSHGLERGRLSAQLRERIEQLEQANATIRALNMDLEQRIAAATAELRDQISARDEFMATVSHDLKSPLTFIKGLANLRRRRAATVAGAEPLFDALEQIEASAGRMAQQLDELVDATRLEAGQAIELRLGSTDLVALARQAIIEHQQTTERHALHVSSDVEKVTGIWDETRLARVLDNLLNNAIKYSPRGGSIEVRVGLDGQDGVPMAVLSVSDHGEGIPPSDLPHVFERFHRGGNVAGRIPGTGIGLSGVRRIVELHSGTISIESQLGEGTTFTIHLPLQTPAA